MKIVIDEDIPFIKGVFEPYAETVYLSGSKITNSIVKDADVLIVRTRTKCDASLLKGSKVRYIASSTIGYDHIDINWCKSNGILWSNATGCNANAVGQYVIAALLELSFRKKIDLSKKTIGIIGVGHVGSIVKQFSESLGMNVLLNDPPRENTESLECFKSLDYIAENSDFITFHTPLIKYGNYKTFHLFDNPLLQKINPSTIVINTSRGEVINEKCLYTALFNKKLGGVILDVWENEPNINYDLLSLVDIATPHIAGYSVEGKAKATEMVVNSVANYLLLPLNNWKVESLLETNNSEIVIDFIFNSLQDTLYKVVTFSYNILNDDFNLRSNYTKFETLRKNYNFRREFSRFTVVDDKAILPQNIINALVNGLGYKYRNK